MLAYFYQDEFVGIWQDQSHEKDWLQRTVNALGHDISQVEVYHCPAIRSDKEYFFNESKQLVVEIDRDEENNILWDEPLTLTAFYPEP